MNKLHLYKTCAKASFAFLFTCSLTFSGAISNHAFAEGASTTVQSDTTTTQKIAKLTANITSLKLRTGNNQPLVLTATYADKSTQIVTQDAIWSTSDEKIATVIAGLVTAISPGKGIITATYKGKTVTIPVEIDVVAKLAANRGKLSLHSGSSQQLSITATYSDKSTADVTGNAEWSSANSSIVTVEKGTVKAIGSGKTKITVKLGGKTVTIIVQSDIISKLTVAPTKVTMKVGETKTLTAKATYSNKSTDTVTDKTEWTSVDKSVASVSGGVITAQKAGKTSIIAVYGGKMVKVDVVVK